MHIRYKGLFVVGLAVFCAVTFGSAVRVTANTTVLSNDATYAAQPFSFYCQPYKNTFETGKHYVPTSGAPCVFSVPTTLAGTQHTIAVYKGIPGNSTAVAVDQYLGSPTLLKEDGVTFVMPLQDQDYFGVIYGANSVGDLNQFNSAFTVGSSSNVLLPSDNYRLIKWKWGAKSVSEYDPLIVIPDIFNSWQTDTGSVIDPIFKTYKNLTDTMLANGYVLNQSLYLFPYNWENSLTNTASALAAKIAAIKTTCGCNRVDIVAHGAGGYPALSYVESAGYQNDVDQLVLLGTGFSGIPAAYKALEGGQISFGSPLADGLTQVLLGQEAKDAGASSVFSYIQSKPSTAFREIVPVFNNYLLDSGLNFISYPAGYPQNTFLENLLANLQSVAMQKVRVESVLSDNGLLNTPYQFVVGNSTQPPLWPHGQPTQTYLDAGDGVVTRSSIETYLDATDLEVAGSHQMIPTNAQSFVFNTLNNKNPSPAVVNTYPVSCVLFITTSNGTDMQITDPLGKRLGKNFSTNTVFTEIPDSLYSGFSISPEYGAVVNPASGQYQIQTQGTINGTFTINASDVCGPNVFSTSTTGIVAPGQILGYGLTVSATSSQITFTSLDTHPPVITITSPMPGFSYLKTDTVSIVASITDPENSPIASAVYRFNGVVVDPLQPLPFGNASLGTSTVSIAATDIFGNTGYATSTFSIKSAYVFGGFLQPINDTGHEVSANTSVFKAGSTVPVKFQFRNAAGQLVQIPGGIPWVAPIRGPALTSPVSEAVYTDQPTSGTTYDWNTDHYQYNWQTSKTQSGYWYYLYVFPGDGSFYYTVVGLR